MIESTASDTTAVENGEGRKEEAPRADGEQRRERRSRDRYGRDRRERGNGERESRPTDEAATVSDATDATADAPAVRSYFDRPSTAAPAPETQPAETVAVADETAQAAADTPAPVAAASVAPLFAQSAAPVAARTATPAEAPVQTASAAPIVIAPAAKAAPFALPVDELAKLAAGAGLSWVNSDADKVAAVQAAIAAEPKPVFVPRERPPAIVVDAGPLVLVETRKDLRNLPLPF